MATAKERRKRRQSRRASAGGTQAQAPSADSAPPAPPPARLRRGEDERPPAPWGSFPLVEITVLVALVLLGIGFFGGNPVALGVGLVLGAAAGLELSVREHFGGYRSHTTLLAATAFVIVVAALTYLADLPPIAGIAAGAAVFAVCFFVLRAAFRRASGGLSFKAGFRF